MASTYAKDTKVSASRSRAEIETTLARYGADAFMYGWEGGNALLAFRMHNRQIKFVVPMPKKDEPVFTHKRVNQSARSFPRSANEALRLWEQACNERWRAFALVIKAKLEAVASGIAVFEDEFLANTIMPDGRTVSEHTRPAIEQAYKTGNVPRLLPPAN